RDQIGEVTARGALHRHQLRRSGDPTADLRFGPNAVTVSRGGLWVTEADVHRVARISRRPACMVPPLVGTLAPTALTLLRRSGCRVHVIRPASVRGVAIVASQSVVAGSVVAANHVVRVVLGAPRCRIRKSAIVARGADVVVAARKIMSVPDPHLLYIGCLRR